MKIGQIYSRFVALTALLLPVLVFSADADKSVLRNSIDSLAVSKLAGSTIVKIGLRQAPAENPSHFSIANPARLVFDLPNTGNGLGYSTKAVNEGILRSLNIVEAGDRARLVLNLDRLARFDLRREDKFLLITLLEEGKPEGAGSAQSFQGAEHKERPEIRDVQFRRGKDGAGIVVVDLTTSDSTIDISQKGTRLFVLFKNTRLPESLHRRLDVVDYATPITMINTRMAGEDVAMEIVPKGLWEHVAFQSDNQFIVEIRPITQDPNRLFQGTKGGYQGEVISLNFQNIPLRELLHVFADITDFNIVVSDSVTGNVSLRLNDVPWDQALEIILQQKNLAMRKNGNVLWIAPRDELAARDKLEAEARDAALAAEIPHMEVFQLNYQKAEDVAKMLESSPGTRGSGSKLSGSGFISANGKITIDKKTNQLFLFDVPTKHGLVRELLKKIDVPPRQVLIEARIVEADDRFSKTLGARLGIHDMGNRGHPFLNRNVRFQIGSSLDELGFRTGQTTGDPGFPVSLASNPRAPSVGAATAQAGVFSLLLFDRARTQFLNLELSALEADRKGKIISSPRVVTADNTEASIEAGTEIPFLQASASGAANIAFKKAVMALKVTPRIAPEGRVMMRLEISRDQPSQIPVPGTVGTQIAIDTRKVQTEVVVENGGTVVIGGIYMQNVEEVVQRMPLLGDLPYIGSLFRQRTRDDDRRELLVFITPRIVADIVTGM